MDKKINETLLTSADELIGNSDRKMMALSLGSNPYAKDNYQMAMAIKLKKTLSSLDGSIKEFDKSNRKSSNIMIWLTAILIILTMLLSWQTFVAFLK